MSAKVPASIFELPEDKESFFDESRPGGDLLEIDFESADKGEFSEVGEQGRRR